MNPPKYFYWHDYETFGANPMFDRPAQFAGLRTDEELNTIGEPLVLYSRPANDFLPHPDACLVTGLTPQGIMGKGIPECEFISQINEEFSAPGTCSVGFNSIRFDDEVTRFTLYRNFFDSYEREWKNGNSRWDIIDVFRAAEALRPQGIKWPRREDGNTSFRLEDLTKANGIEHSGAHDALADVTATISLAKLLREKQPKLFDYALALRCKKRLSKLIKVDNPNPLLFISGIFGAKRKNSGLVLPLWINETRPSEILCFDLKVDPTDLINLKLDVLQDRLYNQNRYGGDGGKSLGLKKIYLNRCPMIVESKILDSQLSERLGIEHIKSTKHALSLKRWREHNFIQFEETCRAILSEQKFKSVTDPDAMLYSGGFFNDSDKRMILKVRKTPPVKLASTSFAFQDARLLEMFKRYHARNYPETLSNEAFSEWEEFRRKRILDPEEGAGISLGEFREILKLRIANPDISREKLALLEELRSYADTLLN